MTLNNNFPDNITAADETAVRSLLDQLMAGWNQGSGAAFAAPFAEDGEQIAFDGSHFQGRRQITEFHQMLFDRFLRGTRLVGKITQIRWLSPNIALAHGIGGTVMAGETDLAPDRNSVQSLVAVKRADGWRIISLHNSRAEFGGRPEAAQALTDELRQLL